MVQYGVVEVQSFGERIQYTNMLRLGININLFIDNINCKLIV